MSTKRKRLPQDIANELFDAEAHLLWKACQYAADKVVYKSHLRNAALSFARTVGKLRAR